MEPANVSPRTKPGAHYHEYGEGYVTLAFRGEPLLVDAVVRGTVWTAFVDTVLRVSFIPHGSDRYTWEHTSDRADAWQLRLADDRSLVTEAFLDPNRYGVGPGDSVTIDFTAMYEPIA